MSLAPEKSTVKELFEYLRIGTPLPKRIPIVQHEPFDLPVGFFPVKVTPHHFNVPNIAQGLVSQYYEVTIQGCAEGASLVFYFGAEFPNIAEAKKAVFKAVGVHALFSLNEGYKGQVLIEVPRNLAKSREQSRALREVLATPSLFPICKGFELKNADWSAWDQLSKKSTEPRKYKGQILHSVKGGAMKQEEIDF
jgi:hypothetical protein